MSQMMQTMHDPVYREKIEQKMAGLKSDPELSNIMQELEGGGPAAMMKCALSTLPEQILMCIRLFSCLPLEEEAAALNNIYGNDCACRYWDNPKVLEKLSGAMGDAFNADAAEAGVHGEDEGEDGEDEPADNSVHEAASSGTVKALGILQAAWPASFFGLFPLPRGWQWRNAVRRGEGAWLGCRGRWGPDPAAQGWSR